MNKKYLSLLLILLGLLTQYTNSQQVLTENAVGQVDGNSYELWKDYGNTRMTLNGWGKFSCEWDSINNALLRIGIVPKLGKSLVQLVLLTMLITGQTEIHICVSMDGLEIL